jgi:hypothetical protein
MTITYLSTNFERKIPNPVGYLTWKLDCRCTCREGEMEGHRLAKDYGKYKDDIKTLLQANPHKSTVEK